jgi:CubicO group peptidase (beta-lactamase class C family)
MIIVYLLAALLTCSLPDDDQSFPIANPKDVAINLAALDRLKVRAGQANSDAVVVVKDGEIIADWTFGKPAGPIEAMSATKSVVNLAIGRLIDQKKIQSIDQPVYDFYPEWKQGRKRLITIRHLLNHTSGLENNPTTGAIYASPDFVQFALAADLSDNPGARFSYNNKAVNLLAGIVAKASGRRMDNYIREEILNPMGITDLTWTLDRAGNPHGMAGLQIRADDLAKIGQMMLDGGTWRGRRIVSGEWVRVSTAQPGQPHDPTCGLLWWLIRGPEICMIDDAMIADLKAEGLTEDSLKKIESLKGKEFDLEGVWAALRPIVHKDKVASRKLKELDDRIRATGRPKPKRVRVGPIDGFAAQGYRGQQLVVFPGLRIVAVRQLRSPKTDSIKTDDFTEFSHMVRDLAPSDPPTAGAAPKPAASSARGL